MMTYPMTNDATGRTFEYPSEGAYLAAECWYNSTSKREKIDWYAAQDFEAAGGPVGEIWADADCTTLVGDWADVVMLAYARTLLGAA